jgi:adenylate cyclase class 2
MLEHEIKLPFADIPSARQAVLSIGGELIHPRRLIDDQLFDSADGRMAAHGTTLRLRRDGDQAQMTVKGPILPGPVKTREEFETPVGNASVVEHMLAILGFRPVFRSQKYREEYVVDAARIAIDEAPFGVFVEIEGSESDIAWVSERLGRTPADYRLESYVALWRQHCLERGVIRPIDMTFANVTSA